jgi:hypothetical protein
VERIVMYMKFGIICSICIYVTSSWRNLLARKYWIKASVDFEKYLGTNVCRVSIDHSFIQSFFLFPSLFLVSYILPSSPSTPLFPSFLHASRSISVTWMTCTFQVTNRKRLCITSKMLNCNISKVDAHGSQE